MRFPRNTKYRLSLKLPYYIYTYLLTCFSFTEKFSCFGIGNRNLVVQLVTWPDIHVFPFPPARPRK